MALAPARSRNGGPPGRDLAFPRPSTCAPVSPSLHSGFTAGSCPSDEMGPDAGPVAIREKIRSRFHGSHDLIHRLFVCISGATSGPGAGRGLGDTQGRGGGRALAERLAQVREVPR